MHPEKLGFEDCDLNSIFKAIDKDTQTIEANSVKSSESSVKSYKLPLPRELEKPEDGTIKVFSFCQVIQDPDCPKLVTIVRESVTEEVHKHNESPNSDAVSNRYRYCKEVIKPYLKDYPPDCPDSGELLLRDAIITANEEFPEYPPCYEVPVNESDIQPEHKTKQEGKYIPPIQSKKSDKPLCPPVQPPACIQPKPDLDCTKKTSHKDIKPKQSKKDLIPAKKSNTSKQSSTSKKSNTSKKSSTSKKSDHKSTKIADCVAEKAALRKAEKCLAEKALAAKCCEKKLAQKECTCPAKKSDKDLSKKCEKKSSKDSCKKKSNKDLCLKPSDKNIAKQGCTCDDKNSDKDKPHLILCPGQKVPKICIEITDPKCCPEIPQPAFCEDEDKRRHQDEACQEDLFPPENCAPEVVEECNCGGSPKDDDCPEKPGKEKSSKSNPKASWPPSIGKKDHTNKKDGSPEKKDCLGCLLESLRRISSDAESCKRKAEKCAELKKKLSSEKKPCPPPTKPPSKPPDSPKRKMGDCPSENPPLNCKPKAKAPCPSTPIDVCSPKERKSSQKGGSKVGEERSKKGAGGSTSTRKVDDSVKGNLVQVQAEERQLGSCTCTTNAEVKSAIDAHHKTLATLKCAMEDFMCKMYRTTQEAVTVITTESAKQLQKIKKSASKSSDECRPPKKVCDTRSKNNLRRFSIVNIDNPNPDTLKKLPDCVPPVGHDGPLKYFDAVVSKVDSAASMISDTLAFDMPKPLKPRTFNDCSSEYDVPNTTRPYPSDITNVLESEGTSSMFASWRDKLWAMFIEDENKPEVEIASKQSGSVTSESDEDLLHKLID